MTKLKEAKCPNSPKWVVNFLIHGQRLILITIIGLLILNIIVHKASVGNVLGLIVCVIGLIIVIFKRKLEK